MLWSREISVFVRSNLSTAVEENLCFSKYPFCRAFSQTSVFVCYCAEQYEQFHKNRDLDSSVKGVFEKLPKLHLK